MALDWREIEHDNELRRLRDNQQREVQERRAAIRQVVEDGEANDNDLYARLSALEKRVTILEARFQMPVKEHIPMAAAMDPQYDSRRASRALLEAQKTCPQRCGEDRENGACDRCTKLAEKLYWEVK